MPESTYLKNYAESFAIFAKYEPATTLDLDYCSIGVNVEGKVTEEDDARLKELGWEAYPYEGGYYRGERHMRLSDFP